MNIYYTIDEKYMKAMQKISWSQFPKAKLMLEEILSQEPGYAKAHHQLGCIYFYELQDYKIAGYHFNLAIQFDPLYPLVYLDYLKLLNDMEEHGLLMKTVEKALKIKGVCKSCVYNEAGISFEQKSDFDEALKYFHLGFMNGIQKCDIDKTKSNKERVEDKISSIKKKKKAGQKTKTLKC
jgi:tetratricopeptide (TPR) repeat protein